MLNEEKKENRRQLSIHLGKSNNSNNKAKTRGKKLKKILLRKKIISLSAAYRNQENGVKIEIRYLKLGKLWIKQACNVFFESYIKLFARRLVKWEKIEDTK